MKLVMRNWTWLAGLLIAVLIGATYLLAQVQTTEVDVGTPQAKSDASALVAPSAQEAADSRRLIESVNAGDATTALGILQTYRLADSVMLGAANQSEKSPVRAALQESFVKASVSLSLAGRSSNVQARLQAAALLGCERPVWVARWLETNWVERCDRELSQSPLAPIAVLNINLDDPNFMRFFQWFDRYADRLHSVVLNGDDLTNAKFKDRYDQANHILNAMFQLIKSRKPEAFVWLSVVKQDDRTDEQWLRAMTFRPDGLQISNLRQFHSPFAETRRRYVEIFGADMPMMVSGFYGYKDTLQSKGKELSLAKKIQDPKARLTAKTDAKAKLGGIGNVVVEDLGRLEADLRTLGYCGLSIHQLLIEAIANKDKAVPIAKSELVDPRVALLDDYYAAKAYKSMTDLSATMLAESAPGDMNWTIAKLYQGIVLLSQSPPQTKKAAAILDEVLAFDFTSLPGRDHYILGAAKWRIHAAVLSGDKVKQQEVVQQVENREFRADLKSKFLKESKGELIVPTIQSK